MKSKQAGLKQTRVSLKLTGFRTPTARSVFWDFEQLDSLKSALDTLALSQMEHFMCTCGLTDLQRSPRPRFH